MLMLEQNNSLGLGSNGTYLGYVLVASIAGLILGLSLIVSIGPQNAYVLQQGAVGGDVIAAVAVCLSADIILIAAGTAGGGALVEGHRWLLTAARLVGAAFILTYAGLASRRAWRAEHGLSKAGVTSAPSTPTGRAGRLAAVSTCLAFTWLNPWVYLDTVVLLGSVANTHPGQRWWFASGAMVASGIWFVGLGYAARQLAPVLRHPRAGQILDLLVAVLMLLTGLRLLLDG